MQNESSKPKPISRPQPRLRTVRIGIGVRDEGVHTVDDNLDLGTAHQAPPLVDEGQYTAVFAHCEKGTFRGRERVFLWFTVKTSCDWEQTSKLCLACPLPKKGKKFSIGSKFYQAWSVAAGRRPSRTDRMSALVFRDKYFRVQVQTVKQDPDGNERPADQHYSKIECLIEIEAGGPACVCR